MPRLGADPAKTVFVSGIGCSSRFPYYMESYGFHTIHGRAPAFATGVKLANPELDVWIITGDGDALSIGGNHTDAPAAPQSRLPDHAVQQRDLRPDQGPIFADQPRSARTRRRPRMGSVDRPASPAHSRWAAGARFVARGIDVYKKLPDVLKAAHAHKGAAFIEIFQNCIVYNKDVFDDFAAQGRRRHQLWLEHGEPMLFARATRASRWITRTLPESRRCRRWRLGSGRRLVHDVTNRGIAHMLVELPFGEFPMALGVLYDDPNRLSKALSWSRTARLSR